jgi:type I restriction enzyme S subunit
MAVENNITSLQVSHCEERSKLKQSVSLIPKLRFKEFEGDWEHKKLGNIFKISAGGDINKSHVSIVKNEKYKYPIYANAEKNKGFYAFSDIYKAQEGTITVAGRGVNIGIAHARNHKFYPIVRLLVLIPKNKESIYFFEYQINRIRLFPESTGVPQLTAPQVSGYQVIFPTLLEQQKIATFLTSVDTKIQQLTTKKQLLENYKKGVMQQLFSQQLRFKPDVIARTKDEVISQNESEFPDWEEKKYNKIYSFYTTNSFSRDKLNYEKGLIKNIHYGDIHTKFSMLFDIENENVPFINEEINLDNIKKENYCQEGDLVIADASEDYNDIGKSIEIINLNNKATISGLHTFLARPNKYNMYIGFSGYLMQTWKVRKQIMTIAQGTKVLSLSTTRLGEVKLNIPSLKEQQKIATYLSAIDDKIENVQTQIEKTQAFKKGLLQQMFV